MTDQPTKAARAAAWAAEMYEKRTRAIAAGAGSALDCDPSARVLWSEIIKPFGLTIGDRDDFNTAFRREMRRRGLLGVLAGRVSAGDWLERANQ